ncbi:MAG: hypothetical protein ACHQU1_12090 [Gemmatimonadales bacterium]
MLRLAASPPWPIFIFWGLIAVLARVAKSKAQPQRPITTRRPVEDSARVELGEELQRAMLKLKQAEREAQAKRTALKPRTEVRARQDYDEEAIRLEESRVREEVEAFERIDAPAARISPSAAMQPARAPASRKVLARFADGSARGAIVLSEILGRPVSDR